VVGVRLEFEAGGSSGEDPFPGGCEVVDEEVEVHLHRYGVRRPHRRAEVFDLLEGDVCVGSGDGRPAGVRLRYAAG
jgi:hypothetical protein